MVLGDDRELQRQAAFLAELTASQNVYLIRKLGRRRIPPIYQSGVVYRADPVEWDMPHPDLRVQYFPTADAAFERKWVDCKGAAPWRVADLRLENPHRVANPESAYFCTTYVRRSRGQVLVHLLVQLPTGEIEDPSRFLHQ